MQDIFLNTFNTFNTFKVSEKSTRVSLARFLALPLEGVQALVLCHPLPVALFCLLLQLLLGLGMFL